MGEMISFSAGTALLIVSLLVMIAYAPSKSSLRTGSGVLGLAIFLGFLADAGNTSWWQIVVTLAVEHDFATYAQLRAIGLYLDGLFKGGAALAGVLHLIAIRMNLPADERREWYWFQMPWYPNRRACLELIASIATWRKGGRS